LFLVLSMSGVAMGVTPPDAVPDVDTTATFEDVDGNGIDDDCQDAVAVADPDAVTAEQATVDADADGVISTTEAAHSNRIGGKNCNHGGYVSWIAHQDACTVEPTEPVAEVPTEGEVVLVVSEPNDTDPDASAPEAVVCDEEADGADTDAEAAKQDKDAARAVKAALKAERALARAAAKAERALARETKRSERAAAHDARKAERQAAKAAKQAERHAAKAARQKGH
jgi:hypothetical protein